jgi:hypothetical protein
MRLLHNKVEYDALREYYGDRCIININDKMKELKSIFQTVSRLLFDTIPDVRKYRIEMYELYRTTKLDLDKMTLERELNKKSWEMDEEPEEGPNSGIIEFVIYDDESGEIPENAQRLRDDLWLFVHDNNVQNHVLETGAALVCSPTNNGELCSRKQSTRLWKISWTENWLFVIKTCTQQTMMFFFVEHPGLWTVLTFCLMTDTRCR